MEVTSDKLREYSRRLMTSRMRLLCNNGFYGLLLMHTKIGISTTHETAWTDLKEKIFFNPFFLEKLSDREIDFVMMHELMHIVFQHVVRMDGRDRELYNVAADLVVNSNILRSNDDDPGSITVEACGGVMPHTVPNGGEAWQCTVEEVFEYLRPYWTGKGNDFFVQKMKDKQWDYHPDGDETDMSQNDRNLVQDMWKSRLMQACEAMSTRQAAKCAGSIPAFVERYINELKNPQTDWRTILDEFIQEEINDYSFCPPDKRFDDCPFYLPDYNEKDYKVEKILFMIDTSGSMSVEEITQCYSEIKGAIDQFDGKLEGWLGFFDAAVIEPQPFVDEDEFAAIKPSGGGGTSFRVIFDYIRDNMSDDLPVSIVILTDGYAHFPIEEVAMDIPVLWIISNEKITPPWGRIARIYVDEED